MIKTIRIDEPAGIDRTHEYVRFAVPFARGEALPNAPMGIIDPGGQPQPCQAKVLKQWPDGSIKWLLADCAISVSAGSSQSCKLLVQPEEMPAPAVSVRVTQDPSGWRVDTEAGTFCVDACVFRPFTSVQRQTDELLQPGGGLCILSIKDFPQLTPSIESMFLEDNGPLRAVINVSGRFSEAGRMTDLRFYARLHFFAGSMAVKIEFTIHNPQAARHAGGLWDLGDPGAVLIHELALTLPFAEGVASEIHCVPERGLPAMNTSGATRLCVYQESSGGCNWQSPTHRNRDGRVPMSRNGYVIEINGVENASGMRATPRFWCGTQGIGVAAALPSFWQEFPKSIEADEKQLKIHLFPARFPDVHELQGGERKTHLICLDFAAQPDDLSWALWPVQAFAAPEEYRAAKILLDLPDNVDLIDSFSTAAAILDKREIIDEYGWRNFGEIYADHESVFHKERGTFVSHYNNQYDFIAGAYRKFFATGNSDWERIAADLAVHVSDIDIYHTGQDRQEYNHGLFWHTDHYIDAGLSSHRSFSREHLKSKDPRSCGGGPGAEHCYTTGLMLHYFQTGNPIFRQSVISLADWVLPVLEGPQTVLAALKQGIHSLNLWRSSRGNVRLFPRYPLTRGTGNAITACLDAYEIGGGKKYLDAAEKLIRGTLHPEDDLNARKLLEAERAWSYTVLLVAVAKYLDKKRELGELDSAFAYARAAFLAYAEWMLDNEYLYLEKPEILEYPNETWPAQDLRKCVIFFQASRYAEQGRRSVFLQKGRYFFENARKELLLHETTRFTRPLVLLLQNCWVEPHLSENGQCASEQEGEERHLFPQSHSGQPTPYLTLASVVSRTCAELIRTFRQTSLRREWAWLVSRVT